MTSFNETPTSERLRIGIFGRRNAGKSSLINAIANQPLAIVSEVAGTTTDPVSKAMEILPLGPVVLTDTAGLDDEGTLGELRVQKSLRTLERTDLVVLVMPAGSQPSAVEDELARRARARAIPLLVVISKADTGADIEAPITWARAEGFRVVITSTTAGSGIEELKNAIIALAPSGFDEPSIVGDLLSPGDLVVLVVPIDKAAPKGRLILPQVMTLRDIIDHDAMGIIVKERELRSALDRLRKSPQLVITDSQAFLKVAADTPTSVSLTSFSILMARYRGNLDDFVAGARALTTLRPGQRVLISEGCTHHRQADDIGSVQIPRWLRQMVGGDLVFGFSSGLTLPDDFRSYDLIVHCGACTLNRREVLYRQREAKAAGVPMTNYGVLLAHVHGILRRALAPFPRAQHLLTQSSGDERSQMAKRSVRPQRLSDG